MAFLDYRPTGTLFQYMSVDSMLGIIESKKLWFTDLLSANDPREITLGNEIFLKVLADIRHTEYRGERGVFVSILAGRLAGMTKNVRLYSGSFSLESDSLPMWNAYGSSYEGVSIGFRPTALFDIPARVHKVVYLEETSLAAFRRVLLELVQKLEPHIRGNNEMHWIEAGTAAAGAMVSLKHASWAYEREVRFVHMQTVDRPEPSYETTGMLGMHDPIVWSEPLVRVRQEESVRYLEFCYGKYEGGSFNYSRSIDVVTLGPKCSLSTDEVYGFFMERGFERFKVIRSQCQIR